MQTMDMHIIETLYKGITGAAQACHWLLFWRCCSELAKLQASAEPISDKV